MNYLKFTNKGPKYVQYFYICWFSYRFSEILKKLSGCFSHIEKMIQTREAPDFIGLHKITNCAF